MIRFSLHELPLEPGRLLEGLRARACGGYVTFEGAVRDHNEGRSVRALEYEAFGPLAQREGERILAEACARFGIERACCAHRIGALQVGDLAVWVGVAAAHRGEAFEACRYIIDQVKHRVPIWKKEHYEDGDSGWVNCEHCARAAAAEAVHAVAQAAGFAHRRPHD